MCVLGSSFLCSRVFLWLSISLYVNCNCPFSWDTAFWEYGIKEAECKQDPYSYNRNTCTDQCTSLLIGSTHSTSYDSLTFYSCSLWCDVFLHQRPTIKGHFIKIELTAIFSLKAFGFRSTIEAMAFVRSSSLSSLLWQSQQLHSFEHFCLEEKHSQYS